MNRVTSLFRKKFFLYTLIILMFLASTPFLFYGIRLWQRPSRTTINDQPLAQGITYSRLLQDEDVPILFHIVEIDLTTPSLTFYGAKDNGREPYDTNAQTVADFVANAGATVAINGSFFNPFHSNSPFDFYPHTGDPVNVQGYAITNGHLYSNDYPEWAAICIKGNDVRIQSAPPCPSETEFAVAGHLHLIENGIIQPVEGDKRYPRTAVAINRENGTMWWLLADGKQPGYSEGATLQEMAQLGLSLGATELIMMDGGGSSTLVYQDANGQIRPLNAPIHTRIPMRLRPVANQLGVSTIYPNAPE